MFDKDMKKPIVKLTKLSKTYKGVVPVKVIKEIDLEIYEGEFTAIVGPSGSGKSTLLNLLGALDRPTGGQILIDDTDINTLDEADLANLRNNKIGFIFQFHYLLPEFSALENAMMPCMIRKGRAFPEDRERMKKLLTDIGLGHRLNNRPSALSGGEQQRVAIVRSLANSPKIILADEPTGNLDRENSRLIFDTLRDLNKKFNTTFLLVTHDPELAKQTDRVISIVDGKIANDTGFVQK